MNFYYFTFGSNHVGLIGTPEHGKSLFRRYVKIIAPDMLTARNAMVEKYSDKWSFCYNEDQFKGQPEQFGLIELETITA